MGTELGEYLRRKREEAQLTQQQVADTAGVSRSVIAEIEVGTRKATSARSRDTLIRIAQVIGADPTRVLELAGHLSRSDVITVRRRPPLEDLISSEPTLTAQDRAALLAVLAIIRRGGRDQRPA